MLSAPRTQSRRRCSTLLAILFCALLFVLVAARPSSVLQWSVSDVQSWLQELSETAGAQEEWRDYADAFAEHQVDGKALMQFGPAELEALQSGSSVDVSLLIAAVQALRETAKSAAAAAAAAASRPSHPAEPRPHQIADLSSFAPSDRERIETLEAFLHFQPDDVPSLLQLAHLYLRSQSTAPRAKQLIDRADEVPKKTGGKAGSNPDVLAANGDFFRKYGQIKRALGFYTRALQLDPLAGGDGAEIRVHLASVLFEEAHALAGSSDSTLESKQTLERMVNALCEALILMPRPDFQPRLTPYQAAIHAALTPQQADSRVGDIEVDIRARYDSIKLMLVQAYLQLSRMYEGQAQTYLAQLKAHPDFAAHVVQLDESTLPSSIPPRALNWEQREEFERVQSHMVHLFAMAFAYAERTVDSVSELASPVASVEARDDSQLFKNTVKEARESMERMRAQWVDPLARKHAVMMHEQLAAAASGSPGPIGYDLFTEYNAHLSNATQLVRAAQFQPPLPTRGAFVHHKLIASMLHAQCKTAAARELISSIREPARDARTNQTLVSLREEEYYLRSSAYPALFTNRKDIRAARAAWESRLDRLLAEARNTTAIVTARLQMTDQEIARFPPLPNAARWGPTDQLERSRFALNSLPSHGLNNRRLSAKLAQFYLALTTPLPSREDPQPKSWLSFEAPGLNKDLKGEYEDQQVRATFSTLSAGSGSAAATVESIRARPAGSKLKIAFVAALHPSLPSLSWLAGYLLHLPRDRFDVCMFEINLAGAGDSAEWVIKEDALGEGENSLYARVHQKLSSEGMWRNLAHRDMDGARAEIMRFAPDMLVYSGLGHDPLSYFLAFSRLAPVQTAFLPATADTTGIPTIDFGIGFTSLFGEEAQAQKAFSERLHLLPGIGWIPRPAELSQADVSKTREDFELSNKQLVERWQVRFDDSTMLAATSGVSSESELFSEASGRRRPLFLVSSDTPAAYSPSFLAALARILAASPSAVLVVLLDPGMSLSPLKASAGEEQLGSLYAGAKNQCKDIVLDRIESLMAGESRIVDHPDARLVAEGADFVAQLTRFMPASQPRRDHLIQSGRVRFMRRPHETKALKQLMNVADVLLQSFPMDDRSDALSALSVNLPTVYAALCASSRTRLAHTPAGRMTHALYAEMHLSRESHTGACSVNEYVDVAVHLGADAAFRSAVAAELALKKDALFERADAIAQFLP